MKKALKSWETVLLCILVLEFIIFATANSKFLMPRVLFGSINDMISICIISLFVTFVMITGGIDIQAGSIVGLTSIVLGVSWQDWGLNIWQRPAWGLWWQRCAAPFPDISWLTAGPAHGGDAGRQLPVLRPCSAGIQPVGHGKLQRH